MSARRAELSDIARAFAPPASSGPSRADAQPGPLGARRADDWDIRLAPPGVSAVLALVREEPEGASLLLTRRASTLRQHAGEISFPGGRIEASDRDPLAAALREAREEIGLDAARVRVLGHLTDFLTHRNVLVVAYVGVVDAAATFVPDPGEVEDVILVPFDQLLDPSRYESRRAAGTDPDWRVHYWHLPECILWGITGELTARLLHRVWGWTPPSEARIITSLDEFAPTRRV